MSVTRDSGYDGENKEGIHDAGTTSGADDSVFYPDAGLYLFNQ